MSNRLYSTDSSINFEGLPYKMIFRRYDTVRKQNKKPPQVHSDTSVLKSLILTCSESELQTWGTNVPPIDIIRIVRFWGRFFLMSASFRNRLCLKWLTDLVVKFKPSLDNVHKAFLYNFWPILQILELSVSRMASSYWSYPKNHVLIIKGSRRTLNGTPIKTLP